MYEFVKISKRRHPPEAARPVSPVGIGQIGGPVFEQTLAKARCTRLCCGRAISIALATTNLLPILLDGGRICCHPNCPGKPMSWSAKG
jgi:hypothetical protein